MRAVRLKFRARVVAGQAPPGDAVHELGEVEGVPFIQGNAEFGPTSPIPRLVTTEAAKVAPPGSVLVSVRAPVGALNLCREQLAIGRGVAAVVPGPELDLGFLWWLLHARKADLRAKAVGSTYDAVSASDLGDLRVPDLPRPTQQAVAAFLDRECARIADLEAELTALLHVAVEGLEGLRGALFHAADLGFSLERGVLPSWPRLSNLVDAWYVGGTPASQSPEYWTDDEGGYEWIAIGDMSGRRFIDKGSRRVTEAGLVAAGLDVAPPGTLLLAMYASVGEIAELRIPATFNQALIGLWIEDPRTRDFVHEWLRAMKPFWSWFTKSNTQANLTQALVRSCPVPPMDDEERFAALTRIQEESGRVAEMSREIEATRELLRQYREALITEAVTGQLDVARVGGVQLEERLHAALEQRVIAP